MADEQEQPRSMRWWLWGLLALGVLGVIGWVAAGGRVRVPHVSWNWLVLAIAVVAMVPLTALLRRGEERELLEKCLLFSLLVHVALVMGFSFISVSRDVIQYVRQEMGLEVPVNL